MTVKSKIKQKSKTILGVTRNLVLDFILYFIKHRIKHKIHYASLEEVKKKL